MTVQIVFALAALLLLGRAVQLQLVDSSYQDRAQATTIEKNLVYPSRGLVYDRNGKLMVNNRAMYDVMVTYRQLNPKMDTAKLCRLLGISDSTFHVNIEKDWRSGRFTKSIPYLFLPNISVETYGRFQESLHEFAGFNTQLRNARGYTYEAGAQMLGFIGEASEKQVEDSKGKYLKGDYIGFTGLERSYEEALKGAKGVEYILKDNVGRLVGSYKKGSLDSSAVAGKDLVSSIDIDLQKYGEELLANKSGGLVAIEPSTGEILAMISMPTFDPNTMNIDNPNRGEEYNQLLHDSHKPFFDRSVMAKYPPGSIFKTLVALIGMQEGVWEPSRYVQCNAGYYYNGKRYGCHHHPSCGSVQSAIQYSCNAYFFTAFRSIVDKFDFGRPQLGLNLFTQHLYDFGLGRTLGIDFPSESRGNVPTSEFYDRIYPKVKGGWRSPTILSNGIGQGEIQLSTVQMANLAATIANRGYFYTPHLVKAYKDGAAIPDKYKTLHKTRIDPQYYEYVIEGMYNVMTSGTGKGGNIPGIEVCGKTGTVQNTQNKNRDHSVFFGFAPKDNPKIAIAAYIELGGWGADHAVPIASLMIEKYLNGKISDARIRLEEKMKKSKLISQP